MDKNEKFQINSDYVYFSDISDEETDRMIETGRREFIEEWFQYIKEYEG